MGNTGFETMMAGDNTEFEVGMVACNKLYATVTAGGNAGIEAT